MRDQSRPTFGTAGIIYTSSHDDHRTREDAWLTEAFRPTPQTRLTVWRDHDIVVVTAQHAAGNQSQPGLFNATLPGGFGLTGLVAGDFFGGVDAQAAQMALTTALLGRWRSDGACAFRDVNGVWVGVVWDREQRTAHIVRDGVGSERLYVVRCADGVAFSTDLRVLRSAGLLGAIDEQAAAEFLHYLYVPPPRAIVHDCHAVLPGHVLSVEPSTTRQERYIGPRFIGGSPLPKGSDVRREAERFLPEFEDRLLTAVSECIPKRGRVLLPLSGGQDSSTIAVALSKICRDRVVAFTVGERDLRMSEVGDAASVAQALGLEHHVYTPTDTDLARTLPRFISEMDQPVGDPAAYPYFLGILHAPEDCDVVIYGAGNDDYFGVTGRDKYLKFKLRSDIQRVVPRALWPHFLSALALGPAGVQRLGKAWKKPIEETFVAWDGWPESELSALWQRPVSLADTELWKMMRTANPSEWRELSQEVIGGLWEPHTGYVKASHFTHAAGKGIRFPFLDSRLKQFGHDLPLELKLDKQILLAYMAKSLPPAIVNKPKGSFMFDLGRLFLNPEYRWAEALQRSGQLHAFGGWAERPIADLLAAYSRSPEEPRR